MARKISNFVVITAKKSDSTLESKTFGDDIAAARAYLEQLSPSIPAKLLDGHERTLARGVIIGGPPEAGRKRGRKKKPAAAPANGTGSSEPPLPIVEEPPRNADVEA